MKELKLQQLSKISTKVQKSKVRRSHLAGVALISGLFGAYIVFSSQAATPGCDQVLNAGTSSNAIVSTINSASTNSTICLHANNGGVSYGNLTFSSARPNNSYATLKSFPGENALFDTIKFDPNASYIKIDRLKIKSVSTDSGATLSTNTKHIKVTNNQIKSMLVGGGSDDWSIEHNYFGADLDGPSASGDVIGCPSGNGSHCLTLSYLENFRPKITNVTVKGNKF